MCHTLNFRYIHLIGRRLFHPFRNETIPIIADENVDIEFGTGCVKITPAHDPNDFEIGQSHNLGTLSILDENGRINMPGCEFHGLPRFEARFKIINALTSLDLFKGKKPHAMSLPLCSRSGDVVEPMVKPQWFLKCGPMAEKALKAEIKFNPDYHSKLWVNWMDGIQDWCISRQLWWGHRIPMYLCTG